MAEKKLCSKGCGKGAVKDDLCTRHYREKYGEAPFKSQAPKKTARKTASKKAKTKGKRANGRQHECPGCQTLQLQIDDLNKAEAIMVAAGLCSAEKFEQARKIVRELA